MPESSERAELDALAERIGYRFDDRVLLARAMAHRSWCAETSGEDPNERLEFLGDAVLGLVVTDHVYRTYPDLPEGELAKVRASVVNSASLAEVAAELRLGDALLLGKGEDLSGGREKPSILADAMEAVIGAVYIDGGWDAAEGLVMRLVGERIAEAAVGPGGQDYKTRLQELGARRYDQLPRYDVLDEGPDHAKRFFATVHLGNRACGEGEGRSKKQAEQAAARVAWERLQAEAAETRDGTAAAAATIALVEGDEDEAAGEAVAGA
ncbi:MAG: ribonuclease III [Actinobacteria bacterium]|nr:ribonuclease III [Actinomycetota bacterium]